MHLRACRSVEGPVSESPCQRTNNIPVLLQLYQILNKEVSYIVKKSSDVWLGEHSSVHCSRRNWDLVFNTYSGTKTLRCCREGLQKHHHQGPVFLHSSSYAWSWLCIRDHLTILFNETSVDPSKRVLSPKYTFVCAGLITYYCNCHVLHSPLQTSLIIQYYADCTHKFTMLFMYVSCWD